MRYCYCGRVLRFKLKQYSLLTSGCIVLKLYHRSLTIETPTQGDVMFVWIVLQTVEYEGSVIMGGL